MSYKRRPIGFLTKRGTHWELIKQDLSFTYRAKTSSEARSVASALRWTVSRQKGWDKNYDETK